VIIVPDNMNIEMVMISSSIVGERKIEMTLEAVVSAGSEIELHHRGIDESHSQGQ